MTIKQYGIELIRLETQYIEMLRQWRNAPEIVQNMEYQEYITAEMQKKWFQNINNLNNFYFLIRRKENWVGMIHLSDVNYDLKETESGIFIGNPDFKQSTFPIMASLVTLDFAFNSLKLEKVYAKVNKNNERALSYNKGIGFRYVEDAENKSFVLLAITRGNYKKYSTKWHKFAEMKYGGDLAIIYDKNNSIDVKIQVHVDM